MNGLRAPLKNERKRTDLLCRDQNLLASVASILEGTVKDMARSGGGGGLTAIDSIRVHNSAGVIEPYLEERE